MSETHVLLAPVHEVADVVVPWLEHSLGGRPSHGIPPHVTLLAPCPADPEGVAEVLDDEAAFDVEFPEVRRFEGVAAYVAPEPADRFVRLTRALWARFPERPPHGGEFLPEITPHLTIAWGAKLDDAEAAVTGALPLRGRVREAVMVRQVDAERWETHTRFPLRGA